MRNIYWLCKLQRIAEVGGKGRKLSIKIPYNILQFLLKPLGPMFGKKAKEEMIKYNQSESKTVANVSLWYLHYPSFPIDYMKEFTRLEFEGCFFHLISKYDEFLKGIYGDYMTPPPVNMRNYRHGYIAYKR